MKQKSFSYSYRSLLNTLARENDVASGFRTDK